MEIYVHIPFCAKKCEYCSFISFPSSDIQKNEYIGALLREAEIRKSFSDEPVKTAYIGGGTPSLLSPEQLRRLVNGLRELFPMDECTEFSIEANPGTITVPFIEALSDLGINRISYGMQAYQRHLLKTLGRIHDFSAVKESVQIARKYSVSNLNLDLIFGIPGQTISDWEETLDAALSLCPQHISAYGLIPEEGTPLWKRLQQGELTLPEPETEREMYDLAIRKLKKHGLEQYEISNFALPGHECCHNIGYWTQEQYIGLGLSASSMRITAKNERGLFCIRRTNPEAMDQYLKMVYNGQDYFTEEHVSPEDTRFETLMLSLRMNRGIRPERFMELHGISIDSCYEETLKKMVKDGLMQYSGGAWSLTRKGMDLQNSVLVEFMED